MLCEYKTINQLAGSDVGKHQYMSCKSGQVGVGGVAAALAVGAAKEVIDFTKKTIVKTERDRYNGVLGVATDGAKDMKNNIIGSFYGLTHSQRGGCDKLLKKGK